MGESMSNQPVAEDFSTTLSQILLILLKTVCKYLHENKKNNTKKNFFELTLTR